VFLLRAEGYSSSTTKVRIPHGDNEAVYQLLGNRPNVPVYDEPVQEYTDNFEMGPLPSRIVTSDLSSSIMSDIEKVRAACNEIKSRGDIPSRRKVAAMTGFGDTKAGELMKQIV
jgi:hypothetical protein